jgi:hypothetical protein
MKFEGETRKGRKILVKEVEEKTLRNVEVDGRIILK